MREKGIDLDVAVATCYVAFVFSGIYKSAWYLDWIPIDLTVLLGLATVVVSSHLAMDRRLKITLPAAILTGLFGVFAGYAVLSGLWTSSVDYYWSKSVRLIGVTGLSLGIGAAVIATSYRRLKYAGIATAGVSTITALETLYQYAMATGNVELYPFGTNYLITGRVIGIGLIVTIGYVIFSRDDERLSAAALIGTALMTYALLVGGARGPMVMAMGAIGLLVLTGIFTGALPNSRRALASYGLLGIASLVGLVTVAQQLRGMRRILQLFEGPGNSLGTRFEYWTGTLDAFGSDMWIFGEGFGSWPLYVYYFVDEQNYPHNIVLEVLFELGLVGLILLTALVLYAIVNIVREWRPQDQAVRIVLGALFIYMLGNAMVSGDLNENRYLFAIVGTMAYSATSRRYAVDRFVPVPKTPNLRIPHNPPSEGKQ